MPPARLPPRQGGRGGSGSRNQRRRLNNPGGRRVLGEFVNSERREASSHAHAMALVGILQTASGHADGMIGALGHGRRQNWLQANLNAFFADDGPLSAFKKISAKTLMRRFGQAENLARSLYRQDHSNDQTGADHEDIPSWVRQFFLYFDAMENQPTASQAAASARQDRRSVSRSLIGAQAPLGRRANQGVASLRTETTANAGDSSLWHQIVGDHSHQSSSA